MSYEVFRRRVKKYLSKSKSHAIFVHEDGRHIARCMDGVTIIGNTVSELVTVKWGYGHSAMIQLS